MIARVAQLLSGFGVSVILARGLGPVEFGIYGVVISLLTWLERLVSAGLPAATAMVMAKRPDERVTVERSARFLLVLYALPLFGTAWALAPTLASHLGVPQGTMLIRIAILNLPVMALYLAYEGIFGGRRMFGMQSALHILQSVAKLIGVVLLLYIGLTVAATFLVHVLATVAAVAVMSLRYQIGRGSSSGQVMRELIRIAVPVGVYSVALTVLMNLSLWQLQSSVAGSAEDVGYFVAGLNLTRIMMMVPASVSGVLYASLVWAISGSRQHLVKDYVQGAVRFALILMVPACVLLGTNAKGVLTLLYGPEYASGGGVLTVLCVAFAMIALLDVLFVALMAAGKQVLSAAIIAASIPALYALNALWIDAEGATGAALASAVTLGIGAIVSLVLTNIYLAAPLRLATVGRVSGAAAVVGILSVLIHSDGVWLLAELASLGALYLALLLLSGEISFKEARHFAIWKPERE